MASVSYCSSFALLCCHVIFTVLCFLNLFFLLICIFWIIFSQTCWLQVFFSSLNSVLFYSWSTSGSISILTFDIFSVLTTAMIPLHLMPHESLTFVLILVINKHKIHKHPEKNHRDSYLNCYKYYIVLLKREGHLSHRKAYILLLYITYVIIIIIITIQIRGHFNKLFISVPRVYR